MENFVVSARKYRPGTFDTVVGQTAITTTLKNAVRHQQLAQAFLFCGPRGVGKTTCARILAKTINCTQVTENIESCNSCESCLNFSTNASFNIFELDAASNNSVEDIRSLIDQVRIPPQTGKYKVYIIDEVHMLSQAAFNAFLKTLEEPPPYAKFILATTEKHKVLPTILSRCQIFDFRRISVEDMMRQLQFVAGEQNIRAEDDGLHIIAQKADGSMRDALSIFDQIVSFSGKQVTYKMVIENLNVLDFEYYFRLTDLILSDNASGALLLLNEIIDNGFDGQHLLMGFSMHLRNLLVGKESSTLKLLEAGESIRTRYLELSGRCTVAFLLSSLEVCNQYDLNYRISNHKRLHLEILLVQLCRIARDIHPDSPTPPPGIITEKKTPELNTGSTVISSGSVFQVEKPSSSASQTSPAGLGSISIKAMQDTIGNHKKEEETETDPAGGKLIGFGQEQLEEVWKEYAEPFREDSPSFYSTLTSRPPQLEAEHRINFQVDHRVQGEMINNKRRELLNFLKGRLQNGLIELNIEITEVPKEDKPYTAVDKFKKIAGNNPAILMMKEQLDLELEI